MRLRLLLPAISPRALKDDTALEGAIDAWNELIFHKAAGNSGAAPAPNA